MAVASLLKRAGEERKPNGRHLSTYHIPCHWMPRRVQSSLRTGICRKAFLKSIFPMRALGPKLFIIAIAESMVQ